MILPIIRYANNSFRVDLTDQKQPHLVLENIQKVRYLALQNINQVAQEHQKRNRVLNEQILIDSEDKLMHEIECLKRENEE